MVLARSVLVTAVASLLVVEGQYTTKSCSGPPTNIYVFDTAHAFDYSSTPGSETWPPYFKFHSSEINLGSPGAEFVPIPGQNCIGSLSFLTSQPYWSGYIRLYTGGYSLDAIPYSANGKQYCYLVSNNFADNSILNGYKSAYFIPDNNICHDNHYKCLPEGNFIYYSDQECTGVSEIIPMSPAYTGVESALLGNISTQYLTVKGASLFFSWTRYTPRTFNILSANSFGDVFVLVVSVLPLFIGLYMIHKTYRALRTAKERHFIKMVNCLAQSFYFGYYLGSIFYLTFSSSSVTRARLAMVCFITLGFATVFDCIVTSSLVSELMFENSQRVKYISISAIILIHISTFGTSYLGTYILNMFPKTVSVPFLGTFLNLQKMSVIWVFFTFFYNTLVPLIVARRALNAQNDKGGKFVFEYDPYLKYYFAAQFAVVAMYLSALAFQKYSTALGNDSENTLPFLFFAMSCHTFFRAKIYGILVSSYRTSKAKEETSASTTTLTEKRETAEGEF
ncbi:hypothetical protein HDV01_001578 [Terramyces sp. JEL0728]|nr:hypothetical protein HDV01_001578 [Terramyces sp. JEL0728]